MLEGIVTAKLNLLSKYISKIYLSLKCIDIDLKSGTKVYRNAHVHILHPHDWQPEIKYLNV